MDVEVQTISRTGLVKWLEDDIRKRRLSPGDQYLTANEVATLYGVSSVTASRAMNVLAAKRILMRRKRQGTFIGPQVKQSISFASSCVHFLTFVDDFISESALHVGAMMTGLNESLPGVTVKTHFGPVSDALVHIRKEVAQVASDKSFAGFVLSLGVREVQEYIATTGLPAVVHGGVYPGIDLPFLEHDQKSIGQLMARTAIAQGHRRLVFVNRQTWRCGDALALDGILAAIHEAGLGADSLHVRNMSVSSDGCRAECGHLIDEFNGPTAFLCRNGFYAPTLADLGKARGYETSKQMSILWDATGGGYASFASPLMEAFVVSQWSYAEQYRSIGQMLAQMRDRRPLQQRGQIVPVRVVLRGSV